MGMGSNASAKAVSCYELCGYRLDLLSVWQRLKMLQSLVPQEKHQHQQSKREITFAKATSLLSLIEAAVVPFCWIRVKITDSEQDEAPSAICNCSSWSSLTQKSMHTQKTCKSMFGHKPSLDAHTQGSHLLLWSRLTWVQWPPPSRSENSSNTRSTGGWGTTQRWRANREKRGRTPLD